MRASIERFELEKGSGPHNCIEGSDGAVWFSGNTAGYIGRFDPRTGKVAKFPTGKGVGDPHTLIESKNGEIWFTVQTDGYVGRLNMKSGAVSVIKVQPSGARPYGIVIDAAGKVWFNEFGRNVIGSIDPAAMKIEEHMLPAGTRDRRIALAAGAVWYGDYARGFLGRLWIVETGPQPNRLIGFDPKTETFFSVTPIMPSGGATVRQMYFDAKQRALWFGTDANTLVRAKLPPP